MQTLDLFSQNLSIKPKYNCFEPFISKGYKGTYYVYYYSFEKGTRTKKTTKTRNQADAIKELSRFKKNYYKGTKQERVNFMSDLKEKILYYFKHSHSIKTLEIYRTAFDKFMAVNGNLPLMQVSLRSIEDFKLRVAEVCSKTTANIYLRTLKSAFNFAKNFGFIFENPFIGVKQFPVPERQKLSFDKTDLSILFDNIDKSFLRRIVLFALYSGARIGEILNIQWSDIDETKKIIKIANKSDFLTKTRRERYIPLFQKLKQIIDDDPYSMHEIRQHRQQDIHFYGKNVIELDRRRERTYVFGKPDGTKFASGFISKSFKDCLRKAGLDEKFHFHCLRHTALTNMANAGVPTFMIKEIAGHSDVKTTQGYVHPSMDDIKKYLDDMDDSAAEIGVIK